MSQDCGLLKNLGGRICDDNFLKGVAAILYSRKGINTFATLSAFTSSAVTTAIHDTDPQDRLLPVLDIEDFLPEQNDPKVATFGSDRMQYIRDSVMKTSFKVIGGDGILKQNFQALNNVNVEAYYFDQFGNMLYRQPKDSTLDQVQGIPISKGSTSPKYVMSNGNDVVEHVMVTQNWDVKLDYSELRTVTSEELGFNIFDYIEPLITVATPEFSTITTTTAVIDVLSDRGTAITGLTTANIASLTADGVAKTVSSLVESTTVEGRYTITWTTAASATDIMVPTWTGGDYDWYTANKASFVIPT